MSDVELMGDAESIPSETLWLPPGPWQFSHPIASSANGGSIIFALWLEVIRGRPL